MKKERCTQKITLRVPASLGAKIAHASEISGLNPSEVIRAWLDRGSLEDLPGALIVFSPAPVPPAERIRPR